MKLRGTIKHISELLVVGQGEKQTDKVTVCIESIQDVQYPDKIAIDFIGDKKDLLDDLEVGDVATFHFNTNYNRRNEGSPEEKIFNSIKGRKIEDIEKGSSKPSSKSDEDDLPFN